MSLTISAVQEAVAGVVPRRDAVVHRARRLSHAAFTKRTRRLAHFLLSRGVRSHTERPALQNWESGQNHVGLYLHNSPEYLEAMIGAFKARAMPFNVNYRYVGEELLYLFGDAKPKVVIYHGCFAETLAGVLPRIPSIELLIRVDDGSGETLLPGAMDYETALAEQSAEPVGETVSPDDLYCTYTGGTTGMPKGVLWRQEDTILVNLGGRSPNGETLEKTQDFVDRAVAGRGYCLLPAPPFMHGAGSQVALAGLLAGNTVVIQDDVTQMDAADLLGVAARERVRMVLIIGDAYGRPLLREIQSGRHDLSSLRMVFNTGAILSPAVKRAILDALPEVRVVDAFGSSESGPQGMRVSTHDNHGGDVDGARFQASEETIVLNEARTEALPPGHEGLGWLAKRGIVPLGYLGDAAKTAETFPEINGVRHLLGGDRVRLLVTGEIEFHGRESFTINSGGEKIFAEEVEHAIKHHPDVADVVVTGRPSERWGQEVVAIVQLHDMGRADREALIGEAARHIARYKLPKAVLFVDTVRRGASGKTDNRWAQSVAGRAT